VQPARIETTFVDDAHAREGLAALPEGSTWRQAPDRHCLPGRHRLHHGVVHQRSGLCAGTRLEREAQLAILIGSVLAAAVGIAILLTTKSTQAPGQT